MANTVLRNAMGHVREERDISSINRLIRWHFQPLRHFVTLPLLLTPHPVMLRGTAMEEFKILKVLFNPPPLPHSATWRVVLNNIGAEAKGRCTPHPLPLCFAQQNIGGVPAGRGVNTNKNFTPKYITFIW